MTGTRAEPCKVGTSVAEMCAAMYALSGILAALRARERTDLGDYIDISMLESMVDWMGAPLYLQMYRNSAPTRNGARHNMIAPYGSYVTGDGAVVNIAVQTRAQWESLCRVVLGRPELTSEAAPHFLRHHLARDITRSVRSSVLHSLLDGRGPVETHARHLNLSTAMPHSVVGFSVRPDDGGSADSNNQRDRFVHNFAASCNASSAPVAKATPASATEISPIHSSPARTATRRRVRRPS